MSKTKKTEIEKELEILRLKNSLKDRFISILSHDLRAPFTSILGFSEILIDEPNLPASEKLEYLNFIHESSENQLKLINYLLDWSKLQSGRLKPNTQKINAQILVFNSVSSLTGNAIRKNIKINVHVDEDMNINADEKLMMQVITNLIGNAVKFSKPYNTIEVFANRFNLDFIEFIIKDEGVGINDENKAKLFKIDKMFTTAGTKGEKGTGMGLSLVKEIIEKHGGEIWYYSELNKGSEFHFTIPNAKDLIILAAKNDVLKDSVRKIIENNYPDHKLEIVEDGFKGFSKLIKNPSALIITEHNLPLMKGIKFVELIKKEDKSNKLPIIVLADKLNKKSKDEYLSYGVSSILKDSNNFDSLQKEINLYLESKN